jgi:hypothetical protein
LQRIGALYAIEADIRGQTAEHRVPPAVSGTPD